jgi:hypothetical protein
VFFALMVKIVKLTVTAPVVVVWEATTLQEYSVVRRSVCRVTTMKKTVLNQTKIAVAANVKSVQTPKPAGTTMIARLAIVSTTYVYRVTMM